MHSSRPLDALAASGTGRVESCVWGRRSKAGRWAEHLSAISQLTQTTLWQRWISRTSVVRSRTLFALLPGDTRAIARSRRSAAYTRASCTVSPADLASSLRTRSAGCAENLPSGHRSAGCFRRGTTVSRKRCTSRTERGIRETAGTTHGHPRDGLSTVACDSVRAVPPRDQMEPDSSRER